MKKPLSYDEFKAIYSKVPKLCVEVVIRNKKGVLLTLRDESAYKGQWHLPGGTLQFRESVEDAVKRVARQELGVTVVVQELLGYVEYFSEEKERGFGYSVALAFLCKTDATTFTLDDQATEAKFFNQVPDSTIEEQKELIAFVLEQSV